VQGKSTKHISKNERKTRSSCVSTRLQKARHRARQIDQAFRSALTIVTPEVQARVMHITTDHICKHRKNGGKPGATAKHPGY
jgi:hypothetical protein